MMDENTAETRTGETVAQEKKDLIEEVNRLADRISAEKGDYRDPVLAHLLIIERQVEAMNAYTASSDRAARAAERQAADARRR